MNLEKIRYILPHRIRTLRYSKGWTQERLAERANIHPTYISRIESGQKLPTLDVVSAIADALGIALYELFMDDTKLNSCNYKKRRLMSIVNESNSKEVNTYSLILDALHSHRKK